MNWTTTPLHRLVTVATGFVFLVSCSSRMPISQSEAIEEKEFYDERLAIRLRDGRELFTKRVSVDDSTLTVYSLTTQGKPVELKPPMVVAWSNVESMEKLEFDDAKTIEAILVVSIPIIFLIALSDFTLGAD